MTKRVFVCAVLMTFGCLFAFADDQSDISEGIRYHNLAETSLVENIEKGKQLLYPLIDTYSLAKGYYGSLLTLEAGVFEKNKNVIQAMNYLEKGTALLDEAVIDDPHVVDVRFLRMINSYELSNQSPMNRYKVMKVDIDWLDARREQFTPNEIGLLDLYKGLYLIKARKLGAAIAAFESCVAVSPGSAEAEEAKKQLRRYAE